MSKDERTLLVGVLTRLRALEIQQREDATSLLQVVHAFCEVRPEYQQGYDNYRPVAERLISERQASHQERQYDELIERLKGDDAP